MSQQGRSDSSPLAAAADIGVADQRHVANLLKAHHALQRSCLFISPERNSVVDFL
jgi:hypothetical protein